MRLADRLALYRKDEPARETARLAALRKADQLRIQAEVTGLEKQIDEMRTDEERRHQRLESLREVLTETGAREFLEVVKKHWGGIGTIDREPTRFNIVSEPNQGLRWGFQFPSQFTKNYPAVADEYGGYSSGGSKTYKSDYEVGLIIFAYINYEYPEVNPPRRTLSASYRTGFIQPPVEPDTIIDIVKSQMPERYIGPFPPLDYRTGKAQLEDLLFELVTTFDAERWIHGDLRKMYPGKPSSPLPWYKRILG